MSEVMEKLNRVKRFMTENGLDGVLLTSNPNFCWISCGKTAFVDKGSESAVAKILVTKEKAYVICNSSECCRIPEEELIDGTFELVTYKWHESEYETVRPLLEGKKIASDSGAHGTVNMAGKLQKLRYVLTKEEEARMDEIGLESAKILEDCVRNIVVGETENEIAGRVTGAMLTKGYQVPVCLVAADERILKYRHPLPKDTAVSKRAMVAVCVQKYGLTISMTRIVSFEPLPEEIQKKYEALLKIDATYILNTKAGIPAKEILKKAYETYASEGYESDFHLHHQGGALGYLTRDYCTNFGTEDVVLDHQGFSWNPTIAGVKLEDTYVVNGDKQRIVSETGTWVYRDVEIDGQVIRRPDILIKEA